jgi:hypothetical protein
MRAGSAWGLLPDRTGPGSGAGDVFENRGELCDAGLQARDPRIDVRVRSRRVRVVVGVSDLQLLRRRHVVAVRILGPPPAVPGPVGLEARAVAQRQIDDGLPAGARSGSSV